MRCRRIVGIVYAKTAEGWVVVHYDSEPVVHADEAALLNAYGEALKVHERIVGPAAPLRFPRLSDPGRGGSNPSTSVPSPWRTACGW